MSDCNTALKINPDSARALKIRGKSYCLLKNWKSALDDFNHACQIDYDVDTNNLIKEIKDRMNGKSNNILV